MRPNRKRREYTSTVTADEANPDSLAPSPRGGPTGRKPRLPLPARSLELPVIKNCLLVGVAVTPLASCPSKRSREAAEQGWVSAPVRKAHSEAKARDFNKVNVIRV